MLATRRKSTGFTTQIRGIGTQVSVGGVECKARSTAIPSAIGLVLDLGAGSLTVYKNRVRLGYIVNPSSSDSGHNCNSAGLSGARGYCWSVSMNEYGNCVKLAALPPPELTVEEEVAKAAATAMAIELRPEPGTETETETAHLAVAT